MNACYLAVKLSFYSCIQETKYHFCIVPLCYEIRFEDSRDLFLHQLSVFEDH